MKLRKRTITRLSVFFIPDLLLAIFLIFSLYYFISGTVILRFIFITILLLLFARSTGYFISSWNFYKKRVNIISDALFEFKKGRFLLPQHVISGDDELTELYDELRVLGKHLDSIFTT